MAKLNSEININKLTNEYTLKVSFTRQFKIRLLIATTLIKAAAAILGCGIKIVNDGDKDEI